MQQVAQITKVVDSFHSPSRSSVEQGCKLIAMGMSNWCNRAGMHAVVRKWSRNAGVDCSTILHASGTTNKKRAHVSESANETSVNCVITTILDGQACEENTAGNADTEVSLQQAATESQVKCTESRECEVCRLTGKTNCSFHRRASVEHMSGPISRRRRKSLEHEAISESESSSSECESENTVETVYEAAASTST